jgi:hypothetical protein
MQYIVLFLETPLLFGVLFFTWRTAFGLKTHLDALAYSIGALTAAGNAAPPPSQWRFLALAEVLYGFLLGVVVLGRVISVLPPLGGLNRRSQ